MIPRFWLGEWAERQYKQANSESRRRCSGRNIRDSNYFSLGYIEIHKYEANQGKVLCQRMISGQIKKGNKTVVRFTSD